MITINLTDAYEKAIVVLALRQFAQSQFREAVEAFTAGAPKEGEDYTERGTKSSEIADRIGS